MDVLSIIGWDSLTPQGIRFGIATILALMTLTPGRPSGFEVVLNFAFTVVAGLMVAQAVSMGH